MTAETLRRAAALMRERAQAAQHADAKEPGRWMTEHHNSQYNSEPDRCHIAEDRKGHYWTVASQVYIPNAEHMAGLDPFTALQIATWLEATAARMEDKRNHSWRGSRQALAVARAYLGESA